VFVEGLLMVSKLGYNYFKRSLYTANNFTNILNLSDPQLNEKKKIHIRTISVDQAPAESN